MCAQVKPEDLKVFYNVAYIDASVNSLTLGDYCHVSCSCMSNRPAFCAPDRKCPFCVLFYLQSVSAVLCL